MSRARTIHRCTECDATSPRWLGRCPECEAWGSLVETAVAANVPATLDPARPGPVPIADVTALGGARIATGVGELDRVLAGGLVPGSVTLFGGEPGVGKSTLLLQALAGIAASGRRCLLVAAEESPQQVRLRAERLGALLPELLVVAETSLPAVFAHVDAVRPDVLAVDSIQTVFDPDAPGAPGSTNQVRACAQQLVGWAKERAIAAMLVGHVTKEGGLAGPRTLEHVVDTVCSFEGDRHHALRLLHALKHRFGPTDELGVFEMDATGLVAVPDASALLLADRVPDAYGSAVVPILSGARPLLVEVQALASPTLGPIAARSTQGFDGSRLPLLLAVLEQRARVAVGRLDVFVNVAGGVRATESGVDLAVALAIVGAAYGLPMPATTVVVGEVGLGGEIRQVAGLERRLVEAARLGFRQAIAPASAPDVGGLDVVRVATLRDAITAALVDDVPPDPCALAAADALLSRAGL